MANHAYAQFWCREFSEQGMLPLYERLLATVPFSATHPGFTALALRAVESAEAPLAEHDLRTQPASAAELVAVCAEHPGADMQYAAQAWWDLWSFEGGGWRDRPHVLELVCWGEQFDEGAFAENGHFQIDLGFEHLFTGHAGLLGAHAGTNGAHAEHPAEAAFLERMADPVSLRAYQEKTRANIKRLLDWVERIKGALPVERYALWSEGEENFEARLDDVLAAR